MASVKNLKKDVHYVLGDIIDMCYIWQFSHPKEASKIDQIIESAILTFDELIEKINQGKNSENKKSHYKAIQKELEEKASALIDDMNAL